MPKTAVKERPILFNTEMVRAVLDGRKTQTRRVITAKKNQTVLRSFLSGLLHWEKIMPYCPYGKVGDRLWVRETWATQKGVAGVIYKADNPERLIDGPWSPSIFMPRWASRITLEITDVRVERVQDITPEDAKAEGLTPYAIYGGRPHSWTVEDQTFTDPCKAFSRLWDSINAQRGYGWDANPWVWVIEFKPVEIRNA